MSNKTNIKDNDKDSIRLAKIKWIIIKTKRLKINIKYEPIKGFSQLLYSLN